MKEGFRSKTIETEEIILVNHLWNFIHFNDFIFVSNISFIHSFNSHEDKHESLYIYKYLIYT
jgi:hypothetical protein